jgi:hypothetical protein
MSVIGLSNLNWADAREAEKRIKSPTTKTTFRFPINSSSVKVFEMKQE